MEPTQGPRAEKRTANKGAGEMRSLRSVHTQRGALPRGGSGASKALREFNGLILSLLYLM